MSLSRTDSVTMIYPNVQAAKQWWIETFDGKEVKVPSTWDCSLPSNIALKLPGYDEPTILLSSRGEVEQAGFDRFSFVVPLCCDKLKKAQEHLSGRGSLAGSIQDDGDTQVFEIHGIESNVIEICREP